MAGRFFSCCKGFILICLILMGVSSPASAFQKNLSGNIDQPSTHVATIGIDRVTVDDVTGFAVNDTILLIQMQGVKIQIGTLLFGNLQDIYGEPGMHEFLIISSINTGAKEIVFKNDILKAYDTRGNIQIVRVPYYNSAIVTGKLFCDPWDPLTKSGGVLAMIVGRTLNLKADIDVSGSGFRGGLDAIGIGICQETDQVNYLKEFYDQTFNNAGFKGEGVANYTEFNLPLFPAYSKGIGSNWTGGGGGNGRFSGGGGGSNRGIGGNGGNEQCYPTFVQAIGGFKAYHTSLPDRIYLGGGGGASTSLTGLASAGGNGGGILILVTDTIVGNGGKLITNGNTGYNAVVNGGSGGGGAGGSIALSLRSYGLNSLEFQLSGGDGGANTFDTYGGGGGGGGGHLFVSTTLTPNVTSILTGGLAGDESGASSAYPGGTGEVVLGFKAILNGFLFNSIRSSVTGDQVDSICSNMLPPVISGTLPVGGTGPYTYTWEKSYDQTTWIPLSTDLSSVNYTPTVIETADVWYRRTVTDVSTPTALVDISKSVKIIVQPFIKNNIIGTSDTICFAQDPPAFLSKAVLQDGNGIYTFNWKVSTDNSLFTLPVNTYNTEGYTPPPALELTSWYKRFVTSGRCVDSTAIVKITVLDSLRNNKILNAPPDICFGTTFDNITATTTPALGGGDDVYKFKWESNFNGAGWVTAPGISNGIGYDPVELPERAPLNEYIFRRVVISGSNDVCVSTSNAVLLKDFPVITNNSISAGQTICAGSIPSILTGSTPLNGNGIYSYTWQDSTKAHTWTNISGADAIDYQPPALTDTIRYRRIVNSSACTDVSKSIIINVHKLIANNSISLISSVPDSIICNGQIPNLLTGTLPTGGTNIAGSYLYQWKYSTDDITYNPVATSGTGINFQPPSLTLTTYYKREVTSGTCSLLSNTVTLTVLPLITNNIISSDQTVCYNLAPLQLTGATPAGGAGPASYTYLWEESADGGSTWSAASGTNNDVSGNYSPPSLTIPMKYRRNVTSGLSGCCTDISNEVTISQYPPLPTGKITNTADTTICGGSDVLLKLELTGTGPWNVTYKENTTNSSVLPAATGNTILSVKPASVSATDIYTYALVKVEDINGCVATTLTGTKLANVYKVPTPVAGVPQTVCGPTVDLSATPSVGTGIWIYPASVISTANSANVTVTIDETYAGGSTTEIFYWEETNWTCVSKAAVSITFEKTISSINAGNDTLLYSFDNIFHLGASPVQTWETGTWSAVADINFSDINDPAAIVSNLAGGSNIFTWTITNGLKCSKSDDVIVSVNDLVIPKGFSPNNDGVNELFIIKGFDLPNQDAELRIVNGAGAEVFSTSKAEGWIDWDGKTSGGYDLPEGTYYYLLKLTSLDNGKIDKRSGYVILKRY